MHIFEIQDVLKNTFPGLTFELFPDHVGAGSDANGERFQQKICLFERLYNMKENLLQGF